MRAANSATRRIVERGDLIVLTIGEPIGAVGGTNTLKIVRVGDHAPPGARPTGGFATVSL